MNLNENTMDTTNLKKIANSMRIELLKMFSTGKAHHFGGSFSCVEIVASLYFSKMQIKSLTDEDRDRFIMSKGHTVPTQYTALALKGLLPLDELKTIKKLGTRLQGHPDINKTPGIEAPTGSLGMGLSYANGIALAARLNNQKFNIFVVMGDGELQEGQPWEAAMTSAHYGIENLCVIVDNNKFQSQGCVDDLMCIEPLDRKFEAFGWNVHSVDGHNLDQLVSVLSLFPAANKKPTVIIADTVKGKGIDFMENTHKYHNYSLNEEEYQSALKQLGGKA